MTNAEFREVRRKERRNIKHPEKRPLPLTPPLLTSKTHDSSTPNSSTHPLLHWTVWRGWWNDGD